MKNSGFTLVELLAVIVVLSIIALIGFSSVGNIIESATTSADKLTIKEYAKAVDQAVFLYEMNNSDKVINIDQEWITNNVKFEKSTVQCERIEYDKVTNLYGCKVNNGDNTYCYNDDVASECNKNKLYKIYGNSVQNGTPTPTNPVEIQSVGEKTKNLFNKEEAGNPNDWERITYKYYPMYVGPKSEVTISYDADLEMGLGFYFVIATEENLKGSQYTYWMYHSTNQNLIKKQVTVTADVNGYIYLNFAGSSANFDQYILNNNFQIEISPSKTDYEPYGYKIPITISDGIDTKTTNIYLDEPLRKIGDYADYIDFENGKVIRKIGKVVLDGSETDWVYDSSLYRFSKSITNANTLENRNPIISNRFISNTSGGQTAGIGFIYSSRIYLYPPTDITSTPSFKTWLSANNTEVVYELSEPIEQSIELPTMPTLTGNVTYEISTSISPSSIEYGY